MDGHDLPARRRRGAVPEIQLDGSVTLYGVEDWTQVKDDPVVLEVPNMQAGDEPAGTGPGEEEGSTETDTAGS